jgi:hypothetical protein
VKLQLVQYGMVVFGAFLLGWMLRLTTSAAPVSASAAAAIGAVETESTAFETPPQVEPPEPEPQAGLALNEQRRVIARLARTGQLHLQARMFARHDELRLSPDIVALLELTPGEVGQLEQVIDAIHEEVRWLELQGATAGYAADGEAWVIEVPTFAEAGAASFDRLNASLGAVLGEERYAFFTEFFGSELEWKLGWLGTRQRTIRLSQDPPTNGSPRQYQLRDQQVVMGEPWGVIRRPMTGAELRQYLGPLALRLPPEWLD